MNIKLYKKVVVIGSPGSGKSYLSSYLGNYMNLEVIHLDDHYWKENWTEPSKEVWEKKVLELTEAKSWIIEGNFSSTLRSRLEKCDLVIYLDFSTCVCLLSVIKRHLSIKLGNKNLLPLHVRDGSKASDGIFKFLLYVFLFKRNNRKAMIKMLNEICDGKKVIVFKNRKSVNKIINKMEKEIKAN